MKKILGLILSIISIMLIMLNNSHAIYASEDSTISFNDETLYNLTNTYAYNSTHKEYESHYYMTDKNNLKVSEGKPLLTVFTHGLGGDASHWSNSGRKFSYSNDSLITRLAKLINSNIYWVKYDETNNLKIYDITEQVYNGITGISSEIYVGNLIEKITDISKHSIIVFEANKTISNGKNEGVYTQFNYAISKIVYDISKLNNGTLPKMNLIGHSRGGITNMQYALDHPDLVHSIYSLGTPYTGSTTASIDLHILKGAFASKESEKEITDKVVYEKYMSRWNDNYESLYSNINVLAIGSYSSLSALRAGLTNEKSLEYIENEIGIDKETFRALTHGVITIVEAGMLSLYVSPVGVTKAGIIKIISGALSELETNIDLSYTAIDDLAQIITNEINLDYHPPFVSWYNDCLVDLGSQLGYEGLVPLDGKRYKGFNTVVKAFTNLNANFDALSVDYSPAVVHNLEARDKELGTYIISEISVGLEINSEYEYFVKSDNTVSINAYIGNSISGTLNIPSHINGKMVTEIGDSAFANNMYGNSMITEVVIPNTVEIIGKSAFENCTNLESIIFSEKSVLKTIDDSAFSGCTNIFNIAIPMQVEKIGNYAFANCTNLSGIFKLPDNLKDFGENAFLSTNISGIDITSNNTSFCVSNYTLYNKTMTELKLSYASGLFNVPDTVLKINKYAFYNNSNITTINLNSVVEIGDYAFFNCTNLTNVNGGDNVKKANIQSFIATKWIENKNIIFLGSALIKYSIENATKYEIPDNITYIGEYAFESAKLNSIYFKPNSNIETISNHAFVRCPNLIYVYILNNNQPIIYQNSITKNDNLRIYVPSINEDAYKHNRLYTNYINNILSKWISVKLFDDENLYKTTSLKYCSIIENFNVPDKIGYDFIG